MKIGTATQKEMEEEYESFVVRLQGADIALVYIELIASLYHSSMFFFPFVRQLN
jgi:hypothetical protein